MKLKEDLQESRMNMKKDVIVITGPTASGKSSIGIELALKLNGVVISADSMQIYKKLNIGTAKVTNQEAKGVKHELIDFVDIDKNFSVSDYKKMCYEKIEEIIQDKKLPIIVGGTGLYINAVVNNMQFADIDEKEDEKISRHIEEIIKDKTNDEIYDILLKMDKRAAEKIDKNNTKRVIHAIKLNLLGQKKGEIDLREDLWNKNESPYNFIVFYIDMPRDLLYDRINKRVDLMVQEGILDEVKMLYLMKDKKITANQAIGYKEFFDYIENKKTLEECKDVLKQKTRNYAKRQITWFKKISDKKIVDGTMTKDEIVQSIIKEYYG